MRFRSAVSILIPVLSVLVLSLSVPVWGVDTTWQHDPATPGDWFDPLNWSPGLPGSAWDDTTFVANGGTAYLNRSIVQPYRLTVAGLDGSSVIEYPGASLQLTYLNIGTSAGTYGLFDMRGGELYGPTYGIEVGGGLSGILQQSGGSISKHYIQIHRNGTYELLGGTADFDRAGYALLVQSGGLFKQTGGVFTALGGYGIRYDRCEIDNGAKWLLDGTGYFHAFALSSNTSVMGDVEQKGGTAVIKHFILGYINPPMIGTYLLSGGELQSTYAYLGYGGTGTLRQTGGNHVNQAMDVGSNRDGTGSGLYQLVDGDFTSSEVHVGSSATVTGTFNQSGGTSTINYLSVASGSSYQYYDGSLDVNTRMDLLGSLDLGNVPVTFTGHTNSWLDFSQGAVLNAGSATLHMQPNSIVTVAPGTDLASVFGTFDNEGTVHVSGTPLDIPAGMTLSIPGNVDEHVRCAGVLNDPGTYTAALNLNSGVEVYGGGSVQCYQLNVKDPSSGISDGQLSATFFTVSTGGRFTQSGGTVTLIRSLAATTVQGGTYEISDGLLQATQDFWVGYGGDFKQSGGTTTIAKNLSIGFNATPASFLLEGGSITADSFEVGSLSLNTAVQTGGSMTARSFSTGGAYDWQGGTLAVTEKFTVTGGQFLHKLNLPTTIPSLNVTGGLFGLNAGQLSTLTETVNGSSSTAVLRQTGATTNATDTLTVGAYGRYELADGTLTVNDAMTLTGVLDFQGGPGQLWIGSNAQFQAPGILDFGNGPGELHIGADSVVNFLGGQILNGSNASMFVGPGTDVFLPTGFDPYTALFDYQSQGNTYISGDTYYVASGQNVQLGGDFDYHVVCAGTVTPDATGAVNLLRGVEVLPGGHVDTGTGRVCVEDATSKITGGQLRTNYIRVGTSNGDGTFTQEGGSVDLWTDYVDHGSLILAFDPGSAGTYVLNGGSLSTDHEFIGYSGAGLFVQNGGTNVVGGYLSIGQGPDTPGTYQMTAGSLQGEIRVGGLFTQTGGTVSGYLLLWNTYELLGPGYVSVLVPVPFEGRFHQDHPDSRVEMPRELIIGKGGRYDLDSGVFTAASAVLREDGRVTQTGGSADLGRLQLSESGQYVLNGGSLAVGNLSLSGNGQYLLNGGSLAVGDLVVDSPSSFNWAGGSLSLMGGLNLAGQMDWNGNPLAFSADHVLVDLTGGGSFANAQQGSFDLGGDSLLVVNPGTDLPSQFAQFSNDGMTHVAGSPLVVPTSQHFSGSGQIADILVCQGGSVQAAPGLGLNLNGGIQLEAGLVNVGSGTVSANGLSSISGGELSGGTLNIQATDPSAFRQTGGTVRSDIYFDWAAVYDLSGTGTIDAYSCTLRGWLLQSAGSVRLDELNICGGWSVPHNQYTMTGGNLTVNSLIIGRDSLKGGFYQDAGTTTVTGHVWVGGPWIGLGALGRLELAGSAVFSAPVEYVGSHAQGEVYQNGGTHNVGELYLGDIPLRGSYYELNAGTLNAGNVYIGNQSGVPPADSTFLQTGGVSNITGNLFLGNDNDTGTYEMRGGQLVVGGQCKVGNNLLQSNLILRSGAAQFNSLQVGPAGDATHTSLLAIYGPDPYVQVSGNLSFGPGARVQADPQSAIHMTGANFENKSTSEPNLAGLANLTLIYDNQSPGATDTFEIASTDLGRNPAGFVNNFALGGIELDNNALVELVDSFNNGNRNGVGGAAEALYVDQLILEAGSTLDLNNLHLYVCDLEDQGGTILNGDLISMCPGDADGDWAVDSADLATWQRSYDPLGTTRTFDQGDWDGNGRIDSADLATWQRNYHPLYMGPASLGSPEVTPEPATLLLVGSGLLTLARVTGRRKRKHTHLSL